MRKRITTWVKRWRSRENLALRRPVTDRRCNCGPITSMPTTALGAVLTSQGKPGRGGGVSATGAGAGRTSCRRAGQPGFVLMDQDRLEEAAACHRQALEIRPGHAESHNRLGVVLAKQGKFDEAVASIQEALRSASRMRGISFQSRQGPPPSPEK